MKRAINRLSIALAAAVLASGCGGGLYVGLGGEFGNAPPSISLAAAVNSVQAGQTVRLVAAAADDDAVDNVAFYRAAEFAGHGLSVTRQSERFASDRLTSETRRQPCAIK